MRNRQVLSDERQRKNHVGHQAILQLFAQVAYMNYRSNLDTVI